MDAHDDATDPQAQFEQIVVPHLDAAYNLARWLAGNDHDAEDIAQEASLRAFRFLNGFRGDNSRSWLLTIVRNTAFTWLKQNRPHAIVSIGEDELLEIEDPAAAAHHSAALHHADRDVLRAALEQLPVEFREVLILREIEGLSYKEISEVADAPIGTVMSRLARAKTITGLPRPKRRIVNELHRNPSPAPRLRGQRARPAAQPRSRSPSEILR